MLVFITAVAVALVVSFICSICEAVLLSISHSQVEALPRRSHAGRWLRQFKRHIDIPIAAILTVNTMAHTVGATVAGATYEEAFSSHTLWLFSIIFTLAVLLFTEIIPKTLGVSYARQLATPVTWIIRGMTWLLRPVVNMTERLSRALRGNHQAPVTSMHEIRLLAKLGKDEGVVDREASRIIQGAADFAQLRVSDVMVPRRHVFFLSTQWSLAKNLQVIEDSGRSRFPLCEGEDLDSFTGIVLARDLLLGLHREPGTSAAELMRYRRDPLVVPETLPIRDLLHTFRSGTSHLAFVVDEYGSTLGLVSLEDVLEELVGDIQDEQDEERHHIWPLPDGSLRVQGDAELRHICKHFDLEWDAATGVTRVNGLLAEQLGSIPQRGDRLEWQGLEFQVLSASPRQAEFVRVIPITAAETTDG